MPRLIAKVTTLDVDNHGMWLLRSSESLFLPATQLNARQRLQQEWIMIRILMIKEKEIENLIVHGYHYMETIQ